MQCLPSRTALSFLKVRGDVEQEHFQNAVSPIAAEGYDVYLFKISAVCHGLFEKGCWGNRPSLLGEDGLSLKETVAARQAGGAPRQFVLARHGFAAASEITAKAIS